MDQIWPSQDNGETLSLIRRRARRLIHCTGMPTTEQEDVEQHLTIELWKQSSRFDPALGSWQDFANTRASQICAKIVRERRALKRDARRCQSLNVEVVGRSGEAMELAEAISESDAKRHIGNDQPSHIMSADLSMDLAQVTSTFSPDWQQTLNLLTTHSKPEVVQATGTKRTTLNSRLKKTRAELLQNEYFEDFRE